jgi:hypothetical protein
VPQEYVNKPDEAVGSGVLGRMETAMQGGEIVVRMIKDSQVQNMFGQIQIWQLRACVNRDQRCRRDLHSDKPL